MVVQLGFLRDAVIEAGASEATAGRAAEEMAGYESAFADIAAFKAEVRTEFAAFRGETQAEFTAVRGETRAEFSAVRGEMRAEFSAVRGEINLLKWMLASVFGLLLAVALKLFLH